MKPSTTLTSVAIGLTLALAGCNNESNQNNDNINGKGAQLEPSGYMYFFEQGVPEAITTTSKTALTTTPLHFKDGKYALKWQYNANDLLTFHQDIGYDPAEDNDITPQTFMAWIYNEIPSAETLKFQFGDDNATQVHFEYGLNFSGWRGISVPFRDMTGTAVKNMDRLRVIAPELSGTVYFDQAMMSIPVDNRWPTPDHQQPFINSDVVNMASKNWTALLMYDDMLKEKQPPFDFSADFDDATGDSAILYTQFDQHLGVNAKAQITQEKIDTNLNKYAAFSMKKNPDGSWQGKQLDHPAHQKFLKTGIISDETLKELTSFANIRNLGKAMLETAKFLRADALSDEQKNALEAKFIDAFQYALDQGWQGGSGQQIISHVGYQTRELFDALFIARKLLAKNDLLEPAQQAMMWFNGAGRIYETDLEITASNVDILNTQLQWMIKSFLLLPNQTDRDEMLTQLQTWLSKTLLASDGLGGGFKADGSIFHHSQHYPAYGKDAFSGLAGAAFGLSHSPYSLTQDAHERIKDALLKMRIYTKETHTPVVLSGRHPDGKQKIAAIPFKWLALAGSPDQKEAIDTDLAAAYANLTNVSKFEGIAAENDPTGTWVMNYASMAVARGENNNDSTQSWLATARGFSRYLVGNETYEANNLYGRYLQYGQLEITPSDFSQRAFSHDGWDWNRFPGTTTIHLPNKQLRAQLNQLPGAGIEEMLLSTETYSGANRLDENTAMFAMKLHGHKKYEQQSLTANKSYFMFDNTVIALGSNINNTDTEHHTETTLFQHNVSKPKSESGFKSVEVNGTAINQLGNMQTLDGDITFKDPAGNRYFVNATADQPVHFSYLQQISNDEDDGATTTGHFATAIIDHGKMPNNRGYEYAIIIEAQTTQNDKPDYTVIQRDTSVHAVNVGAVEAYAFFAPSLITTPKHIISAKTASQIMVKAHASDSLTLSVVNPDFAFYLGKDKDQVDANGEQVEVSIYDRDWRYNLSQPVKTEFMVKGEWKLAEYNTAIQAKIINGNTQIITTTMEAKPLAFDLIKTQTP